MSPAEPTWILIETCGRIYVHTKTGGGIMSDFENQGIHTYIEKVTAQYNGFALSPAVIGLTNLVAKRQRFLESLTLCSLVSKHQQLLPYLILCSDIETREDVNKIVTEILFLDALIATVMRQIQTANSEED